MTLSNSEIELIRRSFIKFGPDVVLDVVDQLDLRSSSQLKAVVGIPLRTLQQKRDTVNFATTAPLPALMGLLEVMSHETLDRVVEVLADHAELPTKDQLSDAIATVQGEGVDDSHVIALMAFAIANEFPAGPHCVALLEERPQWQLPPLPEVIKAAPLLQEKASNDEVKAQRQARREAEKAKKKVTQERVAHTKKKAAGAAPAAKPTMAPVLAERAPITVLPVDRRRYLLTPLESSTFDVEHPLVGFLVHTEVPFSDVDPTQPEINAKERYALVIGVGESALLVRGIYSKETPTRHLFGAWRRLGLDHLSYIDENRLAINTVGTSFAKVGALTNEEWNALF
jgi:hypothetical protein